MLLAVICAASGLDIAVRADEPAPRTILVTVLGPDGEPLVGTHIHSAIWAKEPPKGNHDYTCDAQGQARVQLPNEIEILRLWATRPGHVGLFANWWPARQPDDAPIPDEFTFRLDKGTQISGILKNEEGEPIAGAQVEVMLEVPREKQIRPYPTNWLTDGAGRVTDAEGRWTLDNVPAEDDVQVQLQCKHPDYVSDYTWGKLQSDQGLTMNSLRDGTATLVMPRGISISGFVVDDQTNKIPGAVVVWGDDPYLQLGTQEVHTDDNGRYRFPPLPAQPVKVTVVAAGWAPEQRNVDLDAAKSQVHFALKRGKKLRIRFVDRAGMPVPDVSVGIDEWRGGKALYNHKHPNVIDTQIPRQADDKGVFEWTWAPADEVRYVFYSEGQEKTIRDTFVADDAEHVVTIPK